MANVKTLLLTRPEVQSLALAAEIEATFADVRCLISPLMEISPTGQLPDMTEITALLFTSVNGVNAYGGPRDIPCFCVGDKTAHTARSRGLTAQSANGNAGDLVEMVAAQLPLSSTEILHVRGAETTGNIVGELSTRGFAASDVILYRQDPRPLTSAAKTALSAGEIDAALLYSPRTARLLVAALDTPPPVALCLSGKIAAQWPFGGTKVAPEPTRNGMFTLLREFLG